MLKNKMALAVPAQTAAAHRMMAPSRRHLTLPPRQAQAPSPAPRMRRPSHPAPADHRGARDRSLPRCSSSAVAARRRRFCRPRSPSRVPRAKTARSRQRCALETPLPAPCGATSMPPPATVPTTSAAAACAARLPIREATASASVVAPRSIPMPLGSTFKGPPSSAQQDTAPSRWCRLRPPSRALPTRTIPPTRMTGLPCRQSATADLPSSRPTVSPARSSLFRWPTIRAAAGTAAPMPPAPAAARRRTRAQPTPAPPAPPPVRNHPRAGPCRARSHRRWRHLPPRPWCPPKCHRCCHAGLPHHR